MGLNILLFIIAVLPGLLISYFVYRYDNINKEPKPLLLLCFVLGMLITYPAMKIEALDTYFGWEDMSDFWSLFLSSFVLVALTEELVKFVAFLGLPYWNKAFDQPLDGIIYALMIGMGFATLENILYANQYGIGTILFRAFTAVPAHAVFAVIIGYYAGQAKFENGSSKYWLLAKGLLIATCIHGIYDFFILQEYQEWLMMGATLTLAISIYFAIKMIRIHRNDPRNINTVSPVPDPDIAPTIVDETDNDIQADIFSEMERMDEEDEGDLNEV